jgi:lipopolysaccharide/colanic/teichoic acid biosynthesis glycosyltransferase
LESYLNIKPIVDSVPELEGQKQDSLLSLHFAERASRPEGFHQGITYCMAPLHHPGLDLLGRWSQSHFKRFFDCACVSLSLPLAVPLFCVIALAVRLTSRGPVLFLQERMGRARRTFTIFKFRTLHQPDGFAHNTVTTSENQRFTPVGPFLRRWKLDELPQLWNVLRGDMSLVGARPKLPEHQLIELKYRPGITGAATIIFAREELLLKDIPQHRLDAYYHEVVLPAKYQIDRIYMDRATFFSDLRLIAASVLRRWDSPIVEQLLHLSNLGTNAGVSYSANPAQSATATLRRPALNNEQAASAD